MTIGGILNKLIERVNSIMRRLRILEQDNTVTKTRLDSLDQEFLNQKTQLQETVSELEAKVAGLQEQLEQLSTLTREIVNQLKKTASQSDVKGLEHLIEIYNPIKSEFVTREEAERLVDERLAGRSGTRKQL